MPINATVTAKTGPDKTVTAGALTGYVTMVVNPDRKVLQLYNNSDVGGLAEKEFDLTGVTTFTISISGSTYTVVVS